MLIRYWFYICVKKDLYRATNNLINSLSRNVKYEYDTLKNLEVIDERTYERYLNSKPNQGKSFLQDIQAKSFDGKIGILDSLLIKIKRRLARLTILISSLLLLALFMLSINRVIGLTLILLSLIGGKIVISSEFFSDISAGKKSKSLENLISKTKITYASELKCSTLKESEWRMYLLILPLEIRKTAEILWRDGSYEKISDLLKVAQKL